MVAKPKVRAGNGGLCKTDPKHGESYVLSGSGREYCPHQSHDPWKSKQRKGSTPFLDKQTEAKVPE